MTTKLTTKQTETLKGFIRNDKARRTSGCTVDGRSASALIRKGLMTTKSGMGMEYRRLGSCFGNQYCNVGVWRCEYLLTDAGLVVAQGLVG